MLCLCCFVVACLVCVLLLRFFLVFDGVNCCGFVVVCCCIVLACVVSCVCG